MTATAKPTTPDFDIEASLSRFLTEQAEHNRRADDLRPANKAALFGALTKVGITFVTVTFDGYGDSGQVEDITAQRGDDMVPLPSDKVTICICAPAWGDPGFAARTMTVEQAIEQLAYDFLSESHGGWENNDGAYGEFIFDVAKQTITLDYTERYTATEFYSHDF